MSRKSTSAFDGNYVDQDYSYLVAPAPAAEHAHPQLNPAESAGAVGFGGPDVSGSDAGPGVGGGGGGARLVTTYTSGNPSVDDANEFNIQINFSGKWTPQQQAVVEWAADFYSQIITADVRDDFDLSGNPIDDIAITISSVPIDGSGGFLALTGISAVRDPGSVDQWLPVTASIFLDSTDLKDHSLSGTWDAIILHEIGHALGFVGGLFGVLGLTDGGHFTGANAEAAYGGPVPLEDTGGSGTAGSHWDEATLAPNGQLMSNELMTGFFVPGETTLLSDTTIGALADLGYHVQDPSVGTSMIVDSHLLIV